MLKGLTALLVDIFGQSEHLGLLKPENHLKIIDGYAPAENLREKLTSACAEYKAVEKELEKFGGSDEQRERILDILSFQINEIESAGLDEEEETRLLEKKKSCLILKKFLLPWAARLSRWTERTEFWNALRRRCSALRVFRRWEMTLPRFLTDSTR